MKSQTQAPIHAVCFCTFFTMLLGLPLFAGPVTISALFTMSVVCQYIGLVTPIIARLVGGSHFVHEPFNLGIMNGPVAFVASVYMILMILVFLFPTTPALTSQSMDYAIVVVGGTILLSLGYYFPPQYGGMYWLTGPVHTIKDTNLPCNIKDEP